MREYIERAAVLNKTQEIYHWAGYESRYDEFVSCEDIRNIPAADVEEVRLGRWMDAESDDGCIVWYCSMCSYPVKTIGGYPIYRYCPMCATRMDKEAEHEIS